MRKKQTLLDKLLQLNVRKDKNTNRSTFRAFFFHIRFEFNPSNSLYMKKPIAECKLWNDENMAHVKKKILNIFFFISVIERQSEN